MNIYALSSGRGPSGIAIIRLSGKDAIKIAELVSKKKKLNIKEVNLCKLYNPSDSNLIDEGLLLLFPSPNSFTGDNLVEFHIHGSNAVIKQFLKVLSETFPCTNLIACCLCSSVSECIKSPMLSASKRSILLF